MTDDLRELFASARAKAPLRVVGDDKRHNRKIVDASGETVCFAARWSGTTGEALVAAYNHVAATLASAEAEKGRL